MEVFPSLSIYIILFFFENVKLERSSKVDETSSRTAAR